MNPKRSPFPSKLYHLGLLVWTGNISRVCSRGRDFSNQEALTNVDQFKGFTFGCDDPNCIQVFPVKAI